MVRQQQVLFNDKIGLIVQFEETNREGFRITLFITRIQSNQVWFLVTIFNVLSSSFNGLWASEANTRPSQTRVRVPFGEKKTRY
jgi:hypothetical protein